MGVVTAASSLIDALVKKNPDEYKGCVSLAVSRLSRIVTSSYTDFQVRKGQSCPQPERNIIQGPNRRFKDPFKKKSLYSKIKIYSNSKAEIIKTQDFRIYLEGTKESQKCFSKPKFLSEVRLLLM